jgi:predicted dehydrogenase
LIHERLGVGIIGCGWAGSQHARVYSSLDDVELVAAADVAEIVNRRFMKDLKVTGITIGTEEIQQQEGGTRNVSTIEIGLGRS